MSKLSQTKITQYIREQLGLSQIALAQYLSITLSQLAMYETGKRELPTGVMVKLEEILVFLNQEQTETQQENEITKKQKSKIQDFLERYQKELLIKKIAVERKLESLQKRYNQSIKLLLFVNQIENQASSLLEVLKIQAHSGIEKNGLDVQTKQRLKLESINRQLAYIESVKDK